jgi:hypothetical protein
MVFLSQENLLLFCHNLGNEKDRHYNKSSSRVSLQNTPNTKHYQLRLSIHYHARLTHHQSLFPDTAEIGTSVVYRLWLYMVRANIISEHGGSLQ